MNRPKLSLLYAALVFFACVPLAGAQPPVEVDSIRQEDVIYGRKFGTALTLDVFTPRNRRNGRGLIFCVSGGWFSRHEAINVAFFQELLSRGYTVFAVVHGSQPKFTIPEVLDDQHRAVRFIRHNAKRFEIDPDRLGVYGGSAGGHLSLMQGTAGEPGNPNASDPVDRQSSRVQAVACWFPPTDFLNYGHQGESGLGQGLLASLRAAFDFQEFDSQTKSFVAITEEARVQEIGRQISPLYHVTSDDPPTLIIHGDADEVVPLQQAQAIVAAFRDQNVETELIVKPGVKHVFVDLPQDLVRVGDWFDRHLAPRLP